MNITETFKYKLWCGTFFTVIISLFILKKTHIPILITIIFLLCYLWHKYGYLFKDDKDIADLFERNKIKKSIDNK